MGVQKIINIGNESKDVWGSMEVILDRIEQNSRNTRVAYERAIREFFEMTKGKELEELVEGDLVLNKRQAERYQTNLRNKYKASTVNLRLSALRRMYSRLEDYGFSVTPAWFNLDRYSEHDAETYDALTHEEVIEIIDLVSPTRKGFEKALLIRIAYATAFRKTAIQNLRWTDIIRRDDQWFLKALDKGNKHDYKKISDDLYNEIMKQKDLIDGEKIFELTNRTINRMMNFIRENMDFGDRRIVFHSLKKASIREVAVLTDWDIKAMQRHGNHKDATTMLNFYMEETSMDDLVVVDVNHEVPLNKFDDLTREELLELIKNTDRNTQIKLLRGVE